MQATSLPPLQRDIIANWHSNILLIIITIVSLLYLPYICAYYALLFTAAITISVIIIYHFFRLPKASKQFNTEHCFTSSIFGHRGCVRIDDIDQGTKAAFIYAHDANAKGIECDIRLTKDLVPVVIHDLYVKNHLHNKNQDLLTKKIEELTHKQVKQHLPNILSLEELVIFMNDHIYQKDSNKKVYFYLLLEFKPCFNGFDDKTLRNIMRIMRDVLYLNERVIFISFLPHIIYRFRRMFNEINIGLCYERHMMFNWMTRDKKSHTVELQHKLLYRFVDPLHTFICQYFLPYFCGCSCVGVPAALLSRHMIQHYRQNNIAIFCWGARSMIDIKWLLSNGVTLLADDPLINNSV